MSGTTYWKDTLRPASWRGVPFQVRAEEKTVARQIVVHQYPYRDEVWPEDLGAGTSPSSVTGYLIGDDAVAQRAAMEKAVNQPGPGDLVHPTLGTLNVVCLSFSSSTRWDAGRVIEIAFRFVAYGARIFPAVKADTPQETEDAAAEADTASEQSFLGQMGDALRYGAGVARQAQEVARSVQARANALVGDAAAAVHAVGSLTGQNYMTGRLGRYFRGARAVLQRTNAATNTVAGSIARLNSAREGVTNAGARLVSTAQLLS